jgi:hypothetical protein
MLAGALYLAIIFGALVAGIYYWQSTSSSLIDQILFDNNLNCNESVPTKAKNRYSGEIKEFPNSCKLPSGWQRLSATTDDIKGNWKLYKNEDYGFELKVPADYKEMRYDYNGKVDYLSIYLTDKTKANIVISPKGGQDLLIPTNDPKESSIAKLDGESVRIKKWDLPDGRTLTRYVFIDKVNNWATCADPDKPTTACNRIDLFSTVGDIQNKVFETVASLNFIQPSAETTTDSVYYYADGKVRVYNPNSGNETSSNLGGLETFATIKKITNNTLAYLSHDQVATFDMPSSSSDVLFSRNTENGITYVPDNFAISPDRSKIAIGYKYGIESDLAKCAAKCNGVKAGVLVLDLASGLTKSSFDLSVQATPVTWIGGDIVLNHWATSQFSSVTEQGQITNNNYPAPAGLLNTNSTASGQYFRVDATGAVDVRTQQDRFGSASYLFVNGKVVYKSSLAGINLVQN